MSKSTRRVLFIIVGIVILILVILAAGSFLYLRAMNAELAKLSPLDTQEVIPDVYAVRDQYVNLYLVRCPQGLIAIDAGIDAAHVSSGMAQLGLDPADVTALFLTHTDTDHVGAVGLFEQAQVYIGKDEEQMVNGQTKRAFIISNPALRAHETLADGQRLQAAGCSITAIAAPGHTPGSMVYLVDPGYLFAGDTLSLKDGKAASFNEFFNMDTTRQRESISKLMRLIGVTYVFTGHYGYTAGGVHK
jgi:hydroxyacylglutathione hydrolase